MVHRKAQGIVAVTILCVPCEKTSEVRNGKRTEVPMARAARNESIDPNQIQIIHVWNRCVRRAFLCGLDRATGKSYAHRKQWAQDRLKHLASTFAIDCITYSIMSNHTHQILRSRPDVARQWNDREVATRWLMISTNKDKLGNPTEPRESDIQSILNVPGKVHELRQRLSDVSWWMRYFSQHIAYRSNREDEVIGHFWESRFGSEVLETEASVVNCMIYVDLNPVRAGVAESPEESDFTGAKDRIDDLRISLATTELGDQTLTLQTQEHSIHDWERLDNEHSGWLSPIEIDEANDPIGPDPNSAKRRLSHKGVAAMSLVDYLRLLDFVGRSVRSDKRCAISTELKPILQRLGLTSQSIVTSFRDFGSPDLYRSPPVTDNGSLTWQFATTAMAPT